MKDDIVFMAPFGEERKLVDIGAVDGVRSGMYHIMVDRYYHGRLWLISDTEWQFDKPDKSDLEWVDFMIIVDMIEAKD
jgi:hypothetical protein